MCKLKITKIKLFIPAGMAAPTPPFGPIIAQYGVNTIQFCKEFNETTEGLHLYFNDSILDDFGGFILVVDIYINEDRSYKYFINRPPTSFLLRLLTGVKVGAPRTISGILKKKELFFLAKFKFPSLTETSACSQICGTARSIGIKIVN